MSQDLTVTTVDAALVKVDAAFRALSEAVDFQSTRVIRDTAVAAAAYAREAKDTRLQLQATTLRVCAERKCGEMLAESAAKGERATPRTSKRTDLVDVVDKVPTLAEIGISRDQSAQWQKVAALSEDDFQAGLRITQAITADISVPKVLRAVKGAPRHVEEDDEDRSTYDRPENVVIHERNVGPDEMAGDLYNAVVALGNLECDAKDLHGYLPWYQHRTIFVHLAKAIHLLQEVQRLWPTLPTDRR